MSTLEQRKALFQDLRALAQKHNIALIGGAPGVPWGEYLDRLEEAGIDAGDITMFAVKMPGDRRQLLTEDILIKHGLIRIPVTPAPAPANEEPATME